MLNAIDDKPVSKSRLVDLIYQEKPGYSPSSCLWVIGSLVSEGKLFDLGFGYFIKSNGNKWTNGPTGKKGKEAIDLADSLFPRTSFCIYETTWINEMTKMAGGDELLIIELEKRDLFPFFMEWKKRYRSSVLLNPKHSERTTYRQAGSVVVKALFWKSPIQQDRSIRIEKAIVDLCSDKLLKYLYYGVNLSEISAHLIKEGYFNLSTVLNYAKRRNVFETVKTLLKDNLPQNIASIIQEEDV